MGTILAQTVEDEVVAVGVAAAVKMDYHGGIRIDALYCLIASLGESGILLHVVFSFAHRPQHSVSRLIAYLHPSYVDMIVLE